MEQAFGRVAAVLTAAVLLFIVPVVIHMRQQESMIQLCIMSDTGEFVNEIRNTGILTRQMYEAYQNKIRGLQGSLEIQMVHTMKCLHMGEDGIEQVKKIKTEKEITDCLYAGSAYYFQKGDYIRLEVRRGDETYVSYGGSIKYEN